MYTDSTGSSPEASMSAVRVIPVGGEKRYQRVAEDPPQGLADVSPGSKALTASTAPTVLTYGTPGTTTAPEKESLAGGAAEARVKVNSPSW
jgi:hypothetical protein